MRLDDPNRSCYATGCAEPAEFRCARCGKRCCGQHVRHVQLERRDEHDEAGRPRIPLTRLPSYVRTYSFCLRCK